MIRTVIVDDEKKAREIMRHYLSHTSMPVEIVGEAGSLEEARRVIEETQPELLFLDVELHDKTGFDLLEHIHREGIEVVFVTAFGGYAVKAFQVNALNYLLKPTSQDEVDASLQRYLDTKDQTKQGLLNLMEDMQLKRAARKIAIREPSGVLYVRLDSIIRCEADGNYTRIHLDREESILSSKTLKEYEELFEKEGFIRVHHSHLINLDRVRKYVSGRGGTLIMEDGSEVEVSVRKKEEVVRHLQLG